MPVMHISRAIDIAAPPESVYPLIHDFKKWPSWSPWLIAEPDCQLTYTEDGKGYSWKGAIVGAGEMERLTEEENRAIDCGLTFLEPWKSENRTAFQLEPAGEGGTRLTWTMDGKLPWFLFWMKGSMEAFIGSDYERGLAMLKDLAETGSVPSRLDFEGEQDSPGFAYVGISRVAAIDRIGEAMETDFKRLESWRKEQGLPEAEHAISIYHKWQPAKNRVGYTTAIAVAEPPAELPEGMAAGRLPACRVYAIRHTGAYRHLGNAWAAGMMHARAKQFAQDKKVHPFEAYLNDPEQVGEDACETLVQFPVKP